MELWAIAIFNGFIQQQLRNQLILECVSLFSSQYFGHLMDNVVGKSTVI